MRKSRQAIRRAVRNNPGAAVLVLGCYSDYDARAIAGVLSSLKVPPEKTFIAGHHDNLADRIEQVARWLTRRGGVCPNSSHRSDPHAPICLGRKPGRNDVSMKAVRPPCGAEPLSPASMKTRRMLAVKDNVAGTSRLGPIDRFDGHQRAFVKVQDGCDAFCAFCVVPFTRPIVRSRSLDEIDRECRSLVAAGHKEIVLCGVFLGAFGRDTAIRRRWKGPSVLPRLIWRLAAIEGLWRVRLSSLEPADLTDELIAACRQMPNFAPHFHLPLQSGSPAVLGRMNRQYTVEAYRRAVDRARDAFDCPAITTDVLVGFPGEAEADFAATLRVARYAGFAKIHAFPFSPMQPTAAWVRRREAPPAAVVKQRMAALADLERQLAQAYRRQFLGETVEALVEAPRSPGDSHCQAITDRYLTVCFDPAGAEPRELTGRIVRLRLDEPTPAGLNGTLVDILDDAPVR